MQRSDGDVLYSLQIGRALAAIGVLLYHAALAVRTAYPFVPDLYFKFFALGHFGVDYFFVLSGFIIAHAARSMALGYAGARQYFTTRLIRVYVPYLPISLAMIAVLALLPSLSMAGRSNYSLPASLFLLPSNRAPALAVAWTLQHEVIFYVLFGLCAFVFKRPSLIFLWLLPMLYLLFVDADHWVRIVANILNSEFLFGVGACYLYHNRKLYPLRYALIASGLAIVLASFIIMFNQEHFEYYRVLTGFGYAMIVLGCVYLESQFDFSHFRRLIYFGTISYSLYLIHGPVISLLMRQLPPASMHWSIAFLGLSIAAGAGGMLYFKLVEKPLMAYAKKRFGFRHIAVVIAA